MASISANNGEITGAGTIAALVRLWRIAYSNLLITSLSFLIAYFVIRSLVTTDSHKLSHSSLADLSHPSEIDHELDSDEYEYEDDDPEWVLDESGQPAQHALSPTGAPTRRTMARQSSIVLITSTDPSTDLYHEPIQLEFADSPRGRALKGMPTAIRRVSSSSLGTPSPRDSNVSSPVDGSFGPLSASPTSQNTHFPWAAVAARSPTDSPGLSPLRCVATESTPVRPSLTSSICGSTPAPAAPPSILKREPEVFVSVIPSPTLPSEASTPKRSPNMQGAQSLYPASKGLFAPETSVDDSRRSSLDSDQLSPAVVPSSSVTSTPQWPIFALTGAHARGGGWSKKHKRIRLMEPDWTPYVDTHERARERQERASEVFRGSTSLPSTPIEHDPSSSSLLSPIAGAESAAGPRSASAVGDDEEFWFERTVQSTAASGRDWDWRKRRARAKVAQAMMEQARQRALAQGMTEEAAQESMMDLPLPQRNRHRRREQVSPTITAGPRSQSLPTVTASTEQSGHRPQLTVDTAAATAGTTAAIAPMDRPFSVAGPASSADAYVSKDREASEIDSSSLGLSIAGLSDSVVHDSTKRTLSYSSSSPTSALRRSVGKMVGKLDDSPKLFSRLKLSPQMQSTPISPPTHSPRHSPMRAFPGSAFEDSTSASLPLSKSVPRKRSSSDSAGAVLGATTVPDTPSTSLQVPGRGSSLEPRRRKRSLNSLQTRRANVNKILAEADDCFTEELAEEAATLSSPPAAYGLGASLDEVQLILTESNSNQSVDKTALGRVVPHRTAHTGAVGANSAMQAGSFLSTPSKDRRKSTTGSVADSVSSSNSSGSGADGPFGGGGPKRGWRWRTSPLSDEKRRLKSRSTTSPYVTLSPSRAQGGSSDNRRDESESTTSGSSGSITELRRRKGPARPSSAQTSPSKPVDLPVQVSPLSKSSRRSTILKSADGALRKATPTSSPSPSPLPARVTSRSSTSTPTEPKQPQPSPSLQPEPAPVGMATRARSASISSQNSGRLLISRSSPPGATVALTSAKVPVYPSAKPTFQMTGLATATGSSMTSPPNEPLPPLPVPRTSSRPASREAVLMTPTHSPARRAVAV